MMDDEPVLLRNDEEGVARLTLNRPKQFNALSEKLLAALLQELDAIAAGKSVRCVVVAANGKAFCAGHDLKQMRANPRKEYYQELFGQCAQLMQRVVALPVPVIARVQGIATAAGCQLVATCDMAIATEAARFAVSGINVGLFCSTPAVALTRNIAAKNAFEMLLTGEFIDSHAAKTWGLINDAVAPEELDDRIKRITDSICAKSAVAVSIGKKMFYQQMPMQLADAYEYAAEQMACNMMTEDAGEGIDAFIERRDPDWKDR